MLSQINNNTDRTLYVVFSRFKGVLFTIILWKKPKGVPRRQLWITRQTESIRVAPLGLCFRVIKSKNPPKSWKDDTNCSIYIVINLCVLLTKERVTELEVNLTGFYQIRFPLRFYPPCMHFSHMVDLQMIFIYLLWNGKATFQKSFVNFMLFQTIILPISYKSSY